MRLTPGRDVELWRIGTSGMNSKSYAHGPTWNWYFNHRDHSELVENRDSLLFPEARLFDFIENRGRGQSGLS